MAILEDLDTMGRRRAICPDCGKSRYRGKAFRLDAERCIWCEEKRLGKKTCTKCGIEKTLEDFHKSYKSVVGRSTVCRDCTREYKTEWNRAHPKKVAEYTRRHFYGLEPEEYEEALVEYPNCPVCGCEWTEPPHVDHDHETGAVRGLLCGNCNRGLGLFADDVSRLRAAIEYLENC